MKPPAGISWSRNQLFPIISGVSCSRRSPGSYADVGNDRVMRDSSMATDDSGGRTIRPSAAVVRLVLASGPLSGVELVRRDLHIEMTRRGSRPPLKATLFVADQSGKDDVMRFHVDSPHAVTTQLDA